MAALWEPITVTVDEAMRLSSLGRTFLYECMNDGRISSLKAGKRRLIVLTSLKAFLAPQGRE